MSSEKKKWTLINVILHAAETKTNKTIKSHINN
jgi:hypothetical protein